MFERTLFAIALVVPILALCEPTQACSCASTPAPFCALDLDALESGGSIVFVGTVRDQFPQSPMALMAAGPESWTVDGLRSAVDELLALYEDWISSEDAARYRAASAREELESAFIALSLTQRSAFEVDEVLLGAPMQEVHIFSGYGGGDCGFGFQPGESYLVQALPIKGGQGFSASICSTRVRRLADADRDLAILRAWKEGVTIPREVVGGVQDWTTRGDFRRPGAYPPASNFRFSLDGPNGSVEFVTNSNGAFQVQGLEPVEYGLRVLEPGWSLSRVSDGRSGIDLSEAGCAEIFVRIEQSQGSTSDRKLPE